MSRPRVSVVIPCYNSGATLPQTLASLRAQSWPDLEIVVVDDGSSDPETMAVLEGLDDVALVRQPNAGLPAARNAGFRAASGELVLPLDADDWLEPDAVERLARTLLEADDDIGFAFAHLALEGEASGVLRKRYNLFEQLFLNQLPYCVMIRRALWREIGGYDEAMRQGYEDWEFNIRLGLAGHFGRETPAPLFHYRVSSTGMLMAQSSRRHHGLWRYIQRKHRDAYRLGPLFLLWRRWRRRPSSYPLWLYFGWFAAYKLLPESAFMRLFSALRPMSQSRRASRQTVSDAA